MTEFESEDLPGDGGQWYEGADQAEAGGNSGPDDLYDHNLLPMDSGSNAGDSPAMTYEEAYGDMAYMFRTGHFPNPKLEGRRALLAEHPELRRRVGLEPLRQIIDFADFKCVTGSSIARDEAIEGSDIDGGIVILREPAPLEAEMAFIDELRAQGFNVFHPTEAAAAKAACDDAAARGMVSEDWAEYSRLNRVANEMDLNRVAFIPEEELLEADPSSTPGKTYFRGYSIPNHED